MKLLLDTHAWLWLLSAPERLNERSLAILADPEETLLFSAASSWEIAIKFALKKLELSEPPAVFVPRRLAQGGITPLPVEHAHALRVAQLPFHHRDPFDRLLVAQAQLEDATIVTGDPQFLLYDVDVIWAAAGEPPAAVHERPKRRWGRRRKSTPAVEPASAPVKEPPRGSTQRRWRSSSAARARNAK